MTHFCCDFLRVIVRAYVTAGLILTMVSVVDNKVFRLAWLVPGSNTNRSVNAGTSVGALKLALRSVTGSESILKGHTIQAKFFETDCQAKSAIVVAMEARRKFDPDVIIGPPCEEGMKMIAHLAGFWNLPAFTWYNSGPAFDNQSEYPTLIRLVPPLRIMAKSLVHLLQQHGWRKFSLLYDDSVPWGMMEDAIRNEISQTHFRLVSAHLLDTRTSDADLNLMFTIIKKYSTILVFACPANMMRRYILTATRAGLGDGRYVFIQLDHEFYPENLLQQEVLSSGSWRHGDSQDMEARQAYEHVIRVVIDPMPTTNSKIRVPRNRYSEFCKLARSEAGVVNPDWQLPAGTSCDLYSLFLYDAVLVWSVLAAGLHGDKKDYKDGRLMSQRLLTSFPNVVGATGNINVDEHLDRTGRVFVLDMASDGNFWPVQILNFNTTNGLTVINTIPKKLMFRWGGGRSGIKQTPRDSPTIEPLTGKVQETHVVQHKNTRTASVRRSSVTTIPTTTTATTTRTATTAATTTVSSTTTPAPTTIASTIKQVAIPVTTAPLQRETVAPANKNPHKTKQTGPQAFVADTKAIPVSTRTPNPMALIMARLLAIERAMKARNKRPIVVVEPEELPAREIEKNGHARRKNKRKKTSKAPRVGIMSNKVVTSTGHTFKHPSTDSSSHATTTEAPPTSQVTVTRSSVAISNMGQGRLWVMDSLVEKISKSVLKELSGKIGNGDTPAGKQGVTNTILQTTFKPRNQQLFIKTPSPALASSIEPDNNINTVISQLTGAFDRQMMQMKESLNNITQTLVKQVVNTTIKPDAAFDVLQRPDKAPDRHSTQNHGLSGNAAGSQQLNDNLVDRISSEVVDKLAKLKTTPTPTTRPTIPPNVLVDWLDELPPNVASDIHMMSMREMNQQRVQARKIDTKSTTEGLGLRHQFSSTLSSRRRQPLPVPSTPAPTMSREPAQSEQQPGKHSQNDQASQQSQQQGMSSSLQDYFSLWRQFLESPRPNGLRSHVVATTQSPWANSESLPPNRRPPAWGMAEQMRRRNRRW